MPSNPDPTLPPGITRGKPSAEERIVKTLGWVFVCSFLGGPVIIIWVFGRRATALGTLAPSLLLAFVFSSWYLSIQRRQRRAIEKAGFRICLNCRYSLANLPETGICPECGDRYTLDELRRFWTWTYSND